MAHPDLSNDPAVIELDPITHQHFCLLGLLPTRRLVWDARLSAINIWGGVLADAATLWPWLTSVSLVEWKLEVEEELGALAELPALTSLEIIRCRGLSDAGVHALDACTSLSQLSLKGNVDITGDGAAALGSLTRLTGLNLSGCKSVGDDGVRALSPRLRRLKIVNLAGCTRLTDAGMAALGDVESLESLNLAECDLVSEEGVEELGRLTNLRRLNLRHVCVTETGVRALRRLSALASLELIGNMDLSESGLEAAVSQFPKIRSVSLSSSPTWSARALAAHGTWPELTTLEVDCSYMTDPRWTVGRFKALTSLQIFGLFSLADVVVKALADLPVLTTLCLGRDNVLTGTGLRTIGNSLGNLTRLDLSGCTSEMLGVTCEDVNVLGKLTRLTELDVSGLIELTNVGASSLCGLQSLEHLSLEGCVHITDQGVGALADLRSLTSIDLRHCPRVSGKGIQALRTNLTGLKRLRLGSYTAKLQGSTSSSKVIAEGLDIMSS